MLSRDTEPRAALPSSTKPGAARVALVTGASRGIGLAIAERMARDGIIVVLSARHHVELESAAARLAAQGREVFTHQVDVASEASVAALIEAIEKRYGRLDIVVNNAGISPRVNGAKSLVEHTSLEDWTNTLAVNLTGAFLVARAAIPLLRHAEHGRIVNISSRGARKPSRLTSAHYAASKAGMIGFSRILAVELGPSGITVNCCCPTRVKSAMSQTVGDASAMDLAFIAETPLGRIGMPEDVSAAVAFLVSPEAGFITGAIMDITGGDFMP